MTTEHCHACGRKIGLLAVRYRYRGNVYCEMHEPLTGAHAMTDDALDVLCQNCSGVGGILIKAKQERRDDGG